MNTLCVHIYNYGCNIILHKVGKLLLTIITSLRKFYLLAFLGNIILNYKLTKCQQAVLVIGMFFVFVCLFVIHLYGWNLLKALFHIELIESVLY